MTNKSYAITMSLLRIGLLAGRIAVSPSAAAQPALAAAGQQPALMDSEREIVKIVYGLPLSSVSGIGRVTTTSFLTSEGACAFADLTVRSVLSAA